MTEMTMQLGHLAVSIGQAYRALDHRSARSAMAVQMPEDSLLATKGVAAAMADSTWRNVKAKQAGETCVRGFMADYFATPDNWDVKTSANRVLGALNGWLYAQSRQMVQGNYISSFSGLVLRGRSGHLFHMGDTLVFRLRGAEFEQLNREHTTLLGGYRYPSRALGMDPSLDIDFMEFSLKQGDIFLMTTQSVKGTLMPSDFVQLIRQYSQDLHQACDMILEKAIEKASARGYSSQNFCFQLVRVDQLPAETDNTLGEVYSSLPLPVELAEGEEVDGYRVTEVLSRSQTSRIYAVTDMSSGREMVLKAPAPQLSQRRDFLAHFIMQQWLLERVQSPYVAKAVDVSRPRSCLYFLMERVHGMPLEQWCAEHPQADLKTRLDLIEQLVKAVRALHRRDVLHQRLTPDNLLVDRQGMLKLIDFAVATVPSLPDLPAPLTLVRSAGLTPYSAPEYRLGREPGPRSDQFSIAAIAYEILCGHKPYAGQLESMQSKVDFTRLHYEPSFQHNPMIPAWMDGALRKALQPNPELRYRRLSEFIYDLKKPNPDFTAPADAPLLERNPLAFWKLLSALLLVLLLMTWWS